MFQLRPLPSVVRSVMLKLAICAFTCWVTMAAASSSVLPSSGMLLTKIFG